MKAIDNYAEACKMIPVDEYGVCMIQIDYLHKILLKASGLGVFDGQLFPIGSRLTSKENGELIIAPIGTSSKEIVGIVK